MQQRGAASLWRPVITIGIGALLSAAALSAGCAGTERRRSNGDGGSGGDDTSVTSGPTGPTGVTSSTGAGGGGTNWNEYCDKKAALEAMCFPEDTPFDVQGCKAEGPCMIGAMRPDAVDPYIACELDGCTANNCFTKVGATLPDSEVQASYAAACNAKSSCDGVGGVDWDWCNDDFAWEILSDAILSKLSPCFEEADCVAADQCLQEVTNAAFASCK